MAELNSLMGAHPVLSTGTPTTVQTCVKTNDKTSQNDHKNERQHKA